MKKQMQYERQTIVRSKNGYQPGWERISESQLKRILSPLELRVSLPSGKVIETIVSRYRAVALPDFETFRLTRVYRTQGGLGYDYLRGEYRIELGKTKSLKLALIPNGPGITPRLKRKWTCERIEIEQLERRIYRLARKRGILFNVIH